MPEKRRRSPARFLAPLALLGDDTCTDSASSAPETATDGETTTERKRPRRRRYTVKLNDSLGSIAEKTGVPVERLEELNPQLDPQALVVGQRIKLRE